MAIKSFWLSAVAAVTTKVEKFMKILKIWDGVKGQIEDQKGVTSTAS